MKASDIIIADKGIPFTGRTVGQEPLGGAESAVVALAEALARRGHRLRAYSHCERATVHNGVQWQPLREGLPWRADLYIANRHDELLLGVPFARRRAFWLHNPAWEIDNWHFRWKLAVLPAQVIVLGPYHLRTCPDWLLRSNVRTIPLGLAPQFVADRDPPPTLPPRAIFTSNPGRNLDWLLRVWVERISPRVPAAELHLYCGPQVYRQQPGTGFNEMMQILAQADTLAGHGVVRHEPLGRDDLAERIAGARVMLYRGHPHETFCLALAEAQALGVPCVVQPIGSVAERVRDGVTGFVESDDDGFARRAVQVLTDDDLFASMRAASLNLQRQRTWDAVAADFEGLLPP